MRRATRCTRTRRCSASSRRSSLRPSRSCSTRRSVSPRAAGRRCRCRRPTARARSSSRSTCTATRPSSSTATGGSERVALTPDRPVGDVTREVLAAVREPRRPGGDRPDAAGDAVDDAARRGHRARDLRPAQVQAYFAAATRAALVLAALRAPYRGRSTPVNAWWGSFDLAVGLFSGRPVDPPSTTSSCATRGTRRRSRSAGGRATRATRAPRSTRTRIRAPEDFAARDALAGGGALGRGARRVHPRLGRRLQRRESARRRARVRALGRQACVHRVRLGLEARLERRGRPAAGPA